MRVVVRDRLAALLDAAIPRDFEVATHRPWKLPRGEFVPGVMVLPWAKDGGQPPALVVEIVPPDHDLPVKVVPYAAAGLKHFWVVDVRERVVEAFEFEVRDCRRVGTVTSDAEPTELAFGVGTVVVDLGALLGDL